MQCFIISRPSPLFARIYNGQAATLTNSTMISDP